MVINIILYVTNLNKIVVNVKSLDITYALNILCLVKNQTNLFLSCTFTFRGKIVWG